VIIAWDLTDLNDAVYIAGSQHLYKMEGFKVN